MIGTGQRREKLLQAGTGAETKVFNGGMSIIGLESVEMDCLQ